MYFWTMNSKYVPRIFLSPTLFALHQTMWKHKPTYVSNKQTVTFHTCVTVLCRLLTRDQCAANMKESYESMKLLLGKIKYDEFKWKLHGDLKAVALLLRMQLGYIKYCCFLCEWDSRDKNHYVNKLWPKWTSLIPGEKNVINPPLVLPEKIFLPPLHIKLGLTKNFVKFMDKTGRGFEYLRNKFPNVSDTKIKEGIFIGPQIREPMQHKQ